MPRNAPTCTGRHTSSTVLTCTMSPKLKMVSSMKECSDMEIEYISLPKLKREIRRADRTGDQVFLCCMPRPAVPVDQMYKMQASDDNAGLTPLDANCRFDYTSGRTSTTGRRRSMETYLRIDLVEIIEYASIRKTIDCGYTLTKWTRVN